MDNVYIKENIDWTHIVKYGYVDGNETNLIKRIHDSSEEHPELSTFTHILKFEKNEKYVLPYKEIDKIISLVCSDIKKIEIVEDKYGIHLPLSKKLNKYLIKSETKQSNEFVSNEGISLLLEVLKEEFPLLGLDLIKVYSPEEINTINNSSKKQYKKKVKQDNHDIIKWPEKMNEPSLIQQHILEKILNYFKINHIGHIIECCGLGKSFLAIYYSKILNYKTILIGTPNVILQGQMIDEINNIIPKFKVLLIGGPNESTIDTIDIEIKNTERDVPLFIISTYSSCHKLSHIHFDFKIGDECHHLSGINSSYKGYTMFHTIPSNKSLYMTATKKIIHSNNNEFKVYSMDNENIFGTCIDEKTVKWAIENKVITDYKVVVISSNVETIDDIISELNIVLDDKHIELFISAYMTLKSLETYEDLTHILCYTNTKENSELVKKYIDLLLDKNIFNFNKDDFYNKALHCDSIKSLNYDSKSLHCDCKSQHCHCKLKNEVNHMKRMPYGVISCVYIFGEGFNLPELNGVCFVENMVSTIRIIQCSMRPCRIDKGNLSKIAYLLVPFIDNDNFNDETNSHKKIRSIISNLGIEDENIEQRLIVNKICNHKKGSSKPPPKSPHYVLENDDLELRRLRLRLRRSNDLKSKISEEEEEYLYHKAILQNLNSKHEYDLFKYDDKIEDIELYLKKKGVWPDKGWYDLLSIDTSIYPTTKDEWKSKCKEKNIQSMMEYKRYCEIESDLPLEPDKLYKDWNSNIESELGITRPRRR